jgi:hypothetical protein
MPEIQPYESMPMPHWILYVTRRKTDDCGDCIPLSPWLLLGPDVVLMQFAVGTNTYARLLRVKCGTAACRVMIGLPGIVRFIAGWEGWLEIGREGIM